MLKKCFVEFRVFCCLSFLCCSRFSVDLTFFFVFSFVRDGSVEGFSRARSKQHITMGLVILLLSYVGILTHITFVTISFAAGLYYISEIVEEYSEKCKRIIKILTISTIVIYLLLAVSEAFSWTLIACGLAAQLVHLAILRNFPNIKILSLEFWWVRRVLLCCVRVTQVVRVELLIWFWCLNSTFRSGLTLLFVNHYLAYLHFQELLYSLTEVILLDRMTIFVLTYVVIPCSIFLFLDFRIFHTLSLAGALFTVRESLSERQCPAVVSG